MLGAAPAGDAAQLLDVFVAPEPPPLPPMGPAPLDDVPVPPAPLDDALLLPEDALPVGVQHCSLAGPGQKPGVET